MRSMAVGMSRRVGGDAGCLSPAGAQDRPDARKWSMRARKEGEIVWYTTMSVGSEQRVHGAISSKRHPFLRPSVFRAGGGALLLSRIVTGSRRRAKYFIRRGARHRVKLFCR